MWFQLRSPDLAEDFERLMTEDRDIVRGSLDTVSDWRLTRPADVPGQSIGQADYVLIAEILEVERFEQQASEHVQRLADDLAQLQAAAGRRRRLGRERRTRCASGFRRAAPSSVSNGGCSILRRPVLRRPGRRWARTSDGPPPLSYDGSAAA